MTSVLTRDTREKSRDDGHRNWGDAVTSPGTPRVARSWKKQEGFSPSAFRGSMALPDFRLPASREQRM